ncbi:hypothetical protein BH23VER1_BH23VER1_05240 [soil metagenome]
MKSAPVIDPESFDIEDSEDILGLAKTLVNGRHPGILTTVDADGVPRTRWMSTLAFDDFPVFYTLTAPDSRKVAQIRQHPAVSWMFSNHDLSLILNLSGTARVLTDPQTLKKVWQEAEDLSHAYFLERYSAPPGAAVIETTVEAIECSSPKNGLRFEISPREIAPDSKPARNT